MPEFCIGGPFRESYLRNQLGANPVRAFVGFRTVGEGRLRDFSRLQQLPYTLELSLVEAGSCVPDIRERLGLLIVNTQQQRAKVRPRLPRLGPAADDEFLFVHNLVLAPGRTAAPGLIWGRSFLDDQALPPFPSRPRIEGPSIVWHLFADPERARDMRTNMRLEPGTALCERQPSNVLHAIAKKIEGDDRHRLCLVDLFDFAGSSEVDPSLQPLKPRRVVLFVERHNLGIDQEGPAKGRTQRFHRPDIRRKLRRLIVPKPRPEPHASRGGFWRHIDERPNAI